MDSLGRRRQRTHRPIGSAQTTGQTHYWATPLEADLIGAAGEIAFATRYHLPLPRVDAHGKGDGGIDFQTPIGPVSVKTFLKPQHLVLLPKDMPPRARWYVLAECRMPGYVGRLLGWTTDTVFRWLATEVDLGVGFGKQPGVHRTRLCPMNHLAHGGLIDEAPDRAEEAP